MKKSWVGGLWHNAFRSGNPLFLFIGINILVFVGLGLLSLVSALGFTDISLAAYVMPWIQLPASVTAWLYKPWTLATYMFTQQGLFHVLFNRSEEHTSELQSLMRISYAVFCLKKKITQK